MFDYDPNVSFGSEAEVKLGSRACPLRTTSGHRAGIPKNVGWVYKPSPISVLGYFFMVA
jgi:hypothetical protein